MSLRHLVVFGALLLGSLPALAQGQARIATIDMSQVFDNYYKTQRVKARLEREQKAAEDELKQAVEQWERTRQTLSEDLEKLEQELQSGVLSNEAEEKNRARQKAFRLQLRQGQMELQKLRRQAQLQMQKSFEAHRSRLLKEIKGTIEQIAQDSEINLVLDTSGQTTNNIPPVVYFDGGYDISERVLATLNEGHEDEVAQPTTGGQ